MPTVTLIPTSTTSQTGWPSSNIHTILDDNTNTVTQNASTCNFTGPMEDLDSSLSGATINSVKVTFTAQRGGKGDNACVVALIDNAGSNVVSETLNYNDVSNPQTLETSAVTTQADGSTALTFSYINGCSLHIHPNIAAITANHLFATVDYTAGVTIARNIVTLSSGNIIINNGTITI